MILFVILFASSFVPLNHGRNIVRPNGNRFKWHQNASLEEIMATCEPECHMDACGLVLHNGFSCEQHSVETDDGYILGLQRIKPKNQNAVPVFLQHGLLCSSSNFLTNSRDQSLGYILADAGFDVWLGNSRGNKYSRKHRYMDPKSTQFWQFSWYHMARYDLPASLNYVLKTTGKDKLYYAGHSQGTMMAFAGFPQHKELMKKVKMFFALGPLATLNDIKGLLKYVAPYAGSISSIMRLLGYGEFLGNSAMIKLLGRTVCATFAIKALCHNVLFLITGGDTQQLNQMIRSGKFQAYDYGDKVKNQIYYQQDTPPEYGFSDMTVPVQLYYGGKDWLATPQNVQNMLGKLPNIDRNERIEEYDHLDFIWATNANTKVYQHMTQRIKELEGL